MPTKTKANTPAAPVPTVKPRKGFGISRIDQEEKCNHTWYVRIAGESRAFADGNYGGKRRAYEAAETYRNLMFLRLSPSRQLAASKKRKTAKK